jgi:hypothetical protein
MGHASYTVQCTLNMLVFGSYVWLCHYRKGKFELKKMKNVCQRTDLGLPSKEHVKIVHREKLRVQRQGGWFSDR